MPRPGIVDRPLSALSVYRAFAQHHAWWYKFTLSSVKLSLLFLGGYTQCVLEVSQFLFNGFDPFIFSLPCDFTTADCSTVVACKGIGLDGSGLMTSFSVRGMGLVSGLSGVFESTSPMAAILPLMLSRRCR